MRSVDWKNLSLNDGVLAEPVRDDGRITLWLPADADGEFQYWDRIVTPARPEATAEQGVAATPAAATRARVRISDGLLGKLARKLSRRATESTWILPNGKEVERCGERRADVALAWPAEDAATLDEASVRRRWPDFRRLRPLAEGLFLVEGVGEPLKAPVENPNGASEPVDLVALGERAVESARQRGDAQAESLALTDLGMIAMNAGDAAAAVVHLRQALELCRALGDRGRETDVLSNLGYALLGVGEGQAAMDALDTALGQAREARDVYAEKLVLERICLTLLKFGSAADTLPLIDRALEMARAVGDHQQEPRLLWMQAIALADVNRPDQAIAKAEASIACLRARGKPEAAWYEAQLQRFRTDPSSLGAASSTAMGGPLYAGAVTTATPPAAGQPKGGPGLLKMALTATKAMANFIGSGMKPASIDVQKARLAVCRTCEHHTGLRCRICGCFTNVKVKMTHEQCPIGKWPV